MSRPRPAQITSALPPPRITSSPPSPTITSPPAVPTSVSSPGVPMMVAPLPEQLGTEPAYAGKGGAVSSTAPERMAAVTTTTSLLSARLQSDIFDSADLAGGDGFLESPVVE